MKIRFYRPSPTKRWGLYHIPVCQTVIFTPICFIQVLRRRRGQ